MKLGEIILNIIWILFGVAIVLFIVFMTIKEEIAGMISGLVSLVIYLKDMPMLWRKKWN